MSYVTRRACAHSRKRHETARLPLYLPALAVLPAIRRNGRRRGLHELGNRSRGVHAIVLRPAQKLVLQFFLIVIPHRAGLNWGLWLSDSLCPYCAVVPDPNAEELAEIERRHGGNAACIARCPTARSDAIVFTKARLAMQRVDKIREALAPEGSAHPSSAADGELQPPPRSCQKWRQRKRPAHR